MIYTRNDNGKPIIITPAKIHEGHKMLFGFKVGASSVFPRILPILPCLPTPRMKFLKEQPGNYFYLGTFLKYSSMGFCPRTDRFLTHRALKSGFLTNWLGRLLKYCCLGNDSSVCSLSWERWAVPLHPRYGTSCRQKQ